MGNGMISRRLIAEVSRQLDSGISEKDILVGVMWSGPDRHEIYSKIKLFDKNEDGWEINPIAVAKGISSNWHIINHHWRNPVAVTYYKNFWDKTLHTVYTLEHILRVQWFLKSINVSYFMSTFNDSVLEADRINDIEAYHLYKLIDFDHFLPVSSELAWCQTNQKQFADPNGDHHPSTLQHKAFTEEVIIPFLTNKKFIEV
jgi:hypothetical protein